MRTEVRVGRPFPISGPVSEICNGALLKVGLNTFLVEGDSPVPVSNDATRDLEVDFSLTVDCGFNRIAGSTTGGLEFSEMELQVIERIPVLRYAKPIYSIALSDISGDLVTIDLLKNSSQQFREAIDGGHRCELTAYVISKVGTRAIPKGIWLSRAKFTFGGPEVGFSYAVSPLEEEQYALGVSRKASSYVEIGNSVLRSTVADLEVRLYVDRDLLGKLNMVDSAASTAIQVGLERDVIRSILARLQRECIAEGIETFAQFETIEGAGNDLVRNLGAFWRGKTSGEVFNSLINDGPELLLTHVEAELGYLDTQMKAL